MVLLVETAWANLVLGNNGKGIQERPLTPVALLPGLATACTAKFCSPATYKRAPAAYRENVKLAYAPYDNKLCHRLLRTVPVMIPHYWSKS